MRDQRREPHRARRHEPEELLHVAALGPAHIADRIIDALLFVRGIVAARPVRAREAQLQFLLVIDLSRDLHPHGADHRDDRAVARNRAREFDRIAGVGRGSDDHGIDAVAARKIGHAPRDVVAATDAVVRAELARERDLRVIEIDAENAAAGRLEDLHRQLAEQPQPDDGHRVAEPDLRRPHALQRDRAQRDEGRLVEAHALGDLHRQILRHEDRFGVRGVIHPRAGNAIADAKLLRARPHLAHRPRAAVAERQRRLQPRPHRVDRIPQPVALQLLQHLPHQIRPLLRLAHQRLLREIDRHLLRPRADQRCGIGHQHASAPADRLGNLVHLQHARAKVLNHLLHMTLCTSPEEEKRNPRKSPNEQPPQIRAPFVPSFPCIPFFLFSPLDGPLAIFLPPRFEAGFG